MGRGKEKNVGRQEGWKKQRTEEREWGREGGKEGRREEGKEGEEKKKRVGEESTQGTQGD